MKTEKIEIVCQICGKVFLRPQNSRIKHSLCRSCKMKITYQNDTLRLGAIEKRRKTCLELHNTENVAQVKEFYEKAKKTKIKKYGFAGPFQNEDFQKYCENKAHSTEAMSRKKSTCLEKYGETHHMKNKEISKKLKETYKKETGYGNPMLNPDVKRKIIEKYKGIGRVPGYEYEDQHFDSSWELSFYIWLKDHDKQFIYHPPFTVEYMSNDNKNHIYCPDFLVEGIFYEIKGTQFFNEKNEPFNMYTKTFWWEKYELLQKNNIKILKKDDIKPYLKYVADTYGKKYLASFKIDRILKKEKQ